MRAGTLGQPAYTGDTTSMQVLNEDILPALERLRKEKGAYMQYQAAEATLDRLTRFVAAHRYVTAQQ